MQCPDCSTVMALVPGTEPTRGQGNISLVSHGLAVHHHDTAPWSMGYQCPGCQVEWQLRQIYGCTHCNVAEDITWRKILGG